MIFKFAGNWGFWAPAMALWLTALAVSAVKSPWRLLFSHPLRKHMFGASVIALALFWQLQVDIPHLLALHPLVMMSTTMVFGPALAVWVGSLAVGLAVILSGSPWEYMPVQAFVNVLTPVAAATFVLAVIDRIPERNLFVYMLGGGFLGAMVTVLCMGGVAWLYLWFFGPDPLLVSFSDNYYLTLLMMFPEGFINGALITSLTVLKPELVKTYDDQVYLGDP